jgi:hypothetical protein
MNHAWFVLAFEFIAHLIGTTIFDYMEGDMVLGNSFYIMGTVYISVAR